MLMKKGFGKKFVTTWCAYLLVFLASLVVSSSMTPLPCLTAIPAPTTGLSRLAGREETDKGKKSLISPGFKDFRLFKINFTCG